MKFEKIIISIIVFLTICGGQTPASVQADDELNPVDVINDELTAEENTFAEQMSQPIIDLLIPANLVAIADKTPTASILPTNENSQKLWETAIAVADENDIQNTANLRQAIEKINSLKFEQSQTNQPVQSESAEIVQQTADVPEPEKIQPVPAEPIIADEKIVEDDNKMTADALVGIENRTNEVETPYEMAELLFHAGRLNQAAAYYKQTLKSVSLENRPQDKAWVLFQLGNCLKDSNSVEATKIYTRLLSEHPDSIWTKMARQYNELLTLQMKSKPCELIKQQADELRKAKADE
jgi:tetratricopeptide (TPR) repeat protein